MDLFLFFIFCLLRPHQLLLCHLVHRPRRISRSQHLEDDTEDEDAEREADHLPDANDVRHPLMALLAADLHVDPRYTADSSPLSGVSVTDPAALPPRPPSTLPVGWRDPSADRSDVRYKDSPCPAAFDARGPEPPASPPVTKTDPTSAETEAVTGVQVPALACAISHPPPETQLPINSVEPGSNDTEIYIDGTR